MTSTSLSPLHNSDTLITLIITLSTFRTPASIACHLQEEGSKWHWEGEGAPYAVSALKENLNFFTRGRNVAQGSGDFLIAFDLLATGPNLDFLKI